MPHLISAQVGPVTRMRPAKGNKTRREESLRIDLTLNNGTSSHEHVPYEPRK